MSKYNTYRYIYPPRPKNAIPPSDLDFWDNGSLIAQPKLNGSNCVIFTDGDSQMVMNRHNGRMTNFRLSQDEVNQLYRGNGEWMIINGEYMNKNKKDETNNPFNHKLVVFDILTFNGDYLIGKTFEERIILLDEVYGQVDSDKDYLYQITDNIYRVKSYQTGFNDLFNRLTQIDMLEGLVMKRKNARLERGTTENNNTKSQLKSRKATKNYKF